MLRKKLTWEEASSMTLDDHMVVVDLRSPNSMYLIGDQVFSVNCEQVELQSRQKPTHSFQVIRNDRNVVINVFPEVEVHCCQAHPQQHCHPAPVTSSVPTFKYNIFHETRGTAVSQSPEPDTRPNEPVTAKPFQRRTCPPAPSTTTSWRSTAMAPPPSTIRHEDRLSAQIAELAQKRKLPQTTQIPNKIRKTDTCKYTLSNNVTIEVERWLVLGKLPHRLISRRDGFRYEKIRLGYSYSATVPIGLDIEPCEGGLQHWIVTRVDPDSLASTCLEVGDYLCLVAFNRIFSKERALEMMEIHSPTLSFLVEKADCIVAALQVQKDLKWCMKLPIVSRDKVNVMGTGNNHQNLEQQERHHVKLGKISNIDRAHSGMQQQ